MPKIFTSNTQKIGETGENKAVEFLMKHDFDIKDRNYTKKWGEIDIVAEKSNKIHFIEVKSVSRILVNDVTYETSDQYNPEDNMHPWKLKRMARTIQTYLLDKNIDENKEWQVDLVVVFLDLQHNKTQIKVVEDIIL